MKRYQDIKPSGIEWIGDIPKHWEVISVSKICLEHKQGYYSRADYKSQGFKLLRITDIDDLTNIDYSGCPLVDLDESERQQFSLKKNDFVFARSGSIGRFGIVREESNAIFASYLIRFRFEKKLSPDYLKYIFSSYYFKFLLQRDLHGGANQNIHAGNIKRQNVVYTTSIDEQQAIASFLDRKTQQIDDLISKMRRLIQLLEEEKTAVINRAVAKGLDPDVPMRESGIPRLGEIPAHWKIIKLKYSEDVIMGQSPSSADYNSNQHGLPFLQGNAEFGDESPNPSIWCATSSKRAQKNDILVSVRAPIGAINIANQPYGIGRGLCAVRSKSVSYRYLYYQLLIRKPELESIGTGSIFRAVTVDQIKNIKLWIPPKNEQEEILSYLSSALNTIKQKILAHESQIELLLEYRIALINEAVTGKIDVREEIGFLRESQPEE